MVRCLWIAPGDRKTKGKGGCFKKRPANTEYTLGIFVGQGRIILLIGRPKRLLVNDGWAWFPLLKGGVQFKVWYRSTTECTPHGIDRPGLKSSY